LFSNAIEFATCADGVRGEKHNDPMRRKNMRGLHVIFIGVIFLLIGASAKAEELRNDGHALLQDCTEALKEDQNKDSLKVMWCYGYLKGIGDMRALNTMVSVPPDCTPQKVTIGQMTRIVVEYLQDHPKELHYLSASLVVKAITEAFPCPVQLAPK
jgi:hypothetical protein